MSFPLTLKASVHLPTPLPSVWTGSLTLSFNHAIPWSLVWMNHLSRGRFLSQRHAWHRTTVWNVPPECLAYANSRQTNAGRGPHSSSRVRTTSRNRQMNVGCFLPRSPSSNRSLRCRTHSAESCESQVANPWHLAVSAETLFCPLRSLAVGRWRSYPIPHAATLQIVSNHHFDC
jgi:hypothetical protein